ncbi:hypothetical protein ACEWPM_016180 [Roseovarius sp. S4756]|uniref:hypothetical protein n=1 Tax=Roseovarius maritimus TaxID=3342637 RepID=UPI00372A669F
MLTSTSNKNQHEAVVKEKFDEMASLTATARFEMYSITSANDDADIDDIIDKAFDKLRRASVLSNQIRDFLCTVDSGKTDSEIMEHFLYPSLDGDDLGEILGEIETGGEVYSGKTIVGNLLIEFTAKASEDSRRLGQTGSG